MVRHSRFLVPGLIAAVVGGCGPEAPPAITVGPVAYAENQLLGLTDERRQTLALLTAFGLAVADSSTTELGAPRIDGWTDDRRLDILAAELTLEKNAIGDEVLEAQYLTDPQWELTVRHILFFSERWRSATHRSEAEAKAVRAMESLRAGADFASTAAALSEEPGAEGRQGLLTPGREGSWVPEFWTAALALQPSEISPVTETQYGYHILRLERREIVPFSEARSVVARALATRIEDPIAVFDDWVSDLGSTDGERRARALTEAAHRSIDVPSGERAELVRTWDDQMYRWSATLGFQFGLAPAQVATAALSALSNPSQGANIVRGELIAHAELLEARYPITKAPGGD